MRKEAFEKLKLGSFVGVINRNKSAGRIGVVESIDGKRCWVRFSDNTRARIHYYHLDKPTSKNFHARPEEKLKEVVEEEYRRQLVEKAYHILLDCMKYDLPYASIEEAIGYLGEYLSD